MIKNIIMDIGNVLAYFRWRELMQDLGFSNETIKQLDDHMVNHPIWNEFDRGTLSSEEYITKFKQNNVGYEAEIDQFFVHVEDSIVQYDYTIPWMKKLKDEGYHIYYLSNYPELLFENHKKTRFSFLSYVEGGVVSYEEKLVKPEQEIYQRLFDKYGLIPEECLFYDDRKENVEAAKKAGMHAILFEGAATVELSIEQITKESDKN